MSYQIRRAGPQDVETLVRFNAAMAWETEGKTLDGVVLRAGVEGLLARPDYGFYLVSEVDEQVAGCLMITFEWSDWRNGVFWWVQSVYVEAAHRGRGVYRSLYEYVKQMAAETGGVCGFRLYVEQDNEKAQATYRRLGMDATHYRMFEEMS